MASCGSQFFVFMRGMIPDSSATESRRFMDGSPTHQKTSEVSKTSDV